MLLGKRISNLIKQKFRVGVFLQNVIGNEIDERSY